MCVSITLTHSNTNHSIILFTKTVITYLLHSHSSCKVSSLSCQRSKLGLLSLLNSQIPMAPKKSSVQAQRQPTTTTSSVRVTRAAAKRAADDALSASLAQLPEKKSKKPKAVETQNRKSKPTKNSQEEKPKAVTVTENVADASKKTIVIEHCKQCNSFKTRANLVKEGLEKSVTGITVILNPEKPRRGCFEIREEGGEKFISLLDMKRPFKPMKELDMEKEIADIIDKISN